MDFNDVINSRISVRSYLDTEVDEAKLKEIIENGCKAPTAGNLQPWEFIIVRNTIKKQEIVDTTFVGNGFQGKNTQKWMLDAPVLIVVCGNYAKISERYGEFGKKTLLYLDISACIENMLLTIVNSGLSSCYVSGFRTEDLSRLLKLPENIIPIGIVPVGYAKGAAVKRKKEETISKVHYDSY